jgi:hypothetical protein
MPNPITLSEAQVTRIMEAIKGIGGEVASVNIQLAEMKGTIAAFANGIAEERKAREALGRKVDGHDDLLRGDGKEKGLVEKIGDAQKAADTARDEIKGMRNAIWAVGSPIAVALVIDVLLRLFPMLYGK